MTAEHEALVLSLCTRGLMPPRVQYALLADLRPVRVCYEYHTQKKYTPTKYALARVRFRSLREDCISITIYFYRIFFRGDTDN